MSDVKISEGLYDKLVSRWQAIKEEKYYEGFERLIKEEGIQTSKV